MTWWYRLWPAILLLGPVLCGRGASAQVGHTAASVEWMTSSSDRVVRASIQELSLSEAPTAGSDLPARRHAAVTLRVLETLKGERAERLTVAMPLHDSEPRLREWQGRGTVLLWFLVRSERGAQPEWRLNEGAVPGVLPLELGRRVPRPVFSMDLRLLDTEARILAAVRAAARHRTDGPAPDYHPLPVPRDVMQRTGRAGDANAVIVPADARLERLGRRWSRPGHELWLRQAGIEALRRFKSAANIALLKGLLRDGASSVHSTYGPDLVEYRERVFDARQAAYRVLQAWEVPVAEPVLRVRLPDGPNLAGSSGPSGRNE